MSTGYKQVQPGGYPSHLNSFIQPQNIPASSHNPDHFRKSYDQSMLSPLAYTLPPFMSSCANNSHSQDQGKSSDQFRHFDVCNVNVNILPPHNTNTNTNCTPAHFQNNQNTNSQTPRIRIKDVYSLNKNVVQGQLGLDGGQQQSEQQRYSWNIPFTQPSGVLESQTHTECIGHKKAAVTGSNTSPQFEHRTAEQTFLNNQKQFLQPSGPCYQQNEGLPSKNVESTGSRQMKNDLSVETFKTISPNCLLGRLLLQSSTVDGKRQNLHSNVGSGLYGPGGEKSNPKRNLTQLNNSNYSGSCGPPGRPADDRSNLGNITNGDYSLQQNLPKINEVNLTSRNCSKNALPVSLKSLPVKDVNNQGNCFIKTSTPHAGERSVNRFIGGEGTDRNVALNGQPDICGNFIKDKIPNSCPLAEQIDFTGRHDEAPNGSPSQDRPPTLCTGSISNYRIEDTNKEPHQIDAVNKEYSDVQNSTAACQQKNAVTVCSDTPGNDFTFTPQAIKRGSLHARAEDAPDVPADFHPTIKTEGVESRQSSSDVTSDDLAIIEDLSSDNKSASAPVEHPEVDRVKNPKSDRKKRKEKKRGQEKKEKGEVGNSRVSYKSRINRHKLNLLIQFLKDQKTVGGKKDRQPSRETTKSNSGLGKRKESKAHTVKNKNDSRETISLKSLKSNGQITQSSESLGEAEEREGGRSESAKDSVDASGKREQEMERDSSEPDSDVEIVCLTEQQSRESSGNHGPKGECSAREEKSMVDTVKTYQKLKTHFCLICNLVLSIDSFWVNVVSGEVKCLNCLKSSPLQAEKNNASASNSHQKKGDEAKGDSITDEDEGGLTCDGTCRKTNHLKETVKQELRKEFGFVKQTSNQRKMNCSCRRRRNGSLGDDSQKGKPSEERALKSDKSARNPSREELAERRLSENGPSKGMKDSGGKSRSQGQRCQKAEERDQKDAKGRRHGTDESGRKFPPEGDWPSCKDHATEEVTRKNARHGSKSQTDSREGRDQKKPKTIKQQGWKDTKRGSFNKDGKENHKRGETMEHPRKRKNPDEDFSPRKVHIGSDITRRDSKNSKNSNRKAPNVSDNSERGKLQDHDKANGRFSTEKVKKIGSSKAESGEDSRKETKPPPDGEQKKDTWKGQVASQKAKPSEPAKGKGMDPPRMKSKEKQKASNRDLRRDSRDGEPVNPPALHFSNDAKRESSTTENGGRRMSEEKEGNLSLEKTAKSSSKMAGTKDEHFQKARVLKGKHSAKTPGNGGGNTGEGPETGSLALDRFGPSETTPGHVYSGRPLV